METNDGSPRRDLGAVRELEALDRDPFRAQNEPGARGRLSLYCGQVAAQALRRAGAPRKSRLLGPVQ
ncbi:MAG: hypothetical protein M3Q30_18990 [Actinomycetota bacterium]|nr:hypothetical protein [Actinomycetota bacterium]